MAVSSFCGGKRVYLLEQAGHNLTESLSKEFRACGIYDKVMKEEF